MNLPPRWPQTVMPERPPLRHQRPCAGGRTTDRAARRSSRLTWTCRPGRRGDSLRNSEAGRSPLPGSSTKQHFANTSKEGTSEPTRASTRDRESTDDEIRQLRERISDSTRTTPPIGGSPAACSADPTTATTRTPTTTASTPRSSGNGPRGLFATLGDDDDILPGLGAGAPSAARHHKRETGTLHNGIRIS